MNILTRRILILGAAASLTLLGGCVVGDGYGYGDGYSSGGVGIGLDYYEPVGGYYGGWGRGYHVAPPRGGHDYDHHDGGHGGSRPYRSPPGGHGMPSLPSHGRGGGGRH